MRPRIGDEQIKIMITITRRSPQQNCHVPALINCPIAQFCIVPTTP